YGHVYASFEDLKAACNFGRCVVLYVDLPDLLPCGRIYGIRVSLPVTKERDGAGFHTMKGHCASNAGVRVEHPIHAARCGVERINRARIGADEYATANHRWLAVYRFRARES